MTSLSCRCYAKPYHNDFADWDVLTAVSPLLPCAVLGVCRQLPQRFRRYFSKQSSLRDKILREDFRQNDIHTHDADHNHYTKNVDNDDDGNGQRWICWWSDDDDVCFLVPYISPTRSSTRALVQDLHQFGSTSIVHSVFRCQIFQRTPALKHEHVPAAAKPAHTAPVQPSRRKSWPLIPRNLTQQTVNDTCDYKRRQRS